MQKTTKTSIEYELIVVDNFSDKYTKKLLCDLYSAGQIDKIHFNDCNYLFAKGNNIASRMADSSTTHYLLLNSDVKIKNPKWLDILCDLHSSPGITSYGVVESAPTRADGYCMLIDKYLYDKFLLDEKFEWWWSVTKLESEILKENLYIRAVKNHEKQLHHYGGKSGKGYIDAKGMDIDIENVISWFENATGKVEIIRKI